MNDKLSDEDRKLLEQLNVTDKPTGSAPAKDDADEKADEDDKPKRRSRKDKEDDEEKSSESSERGLHTPVQYGDDGWNGLPVQMRG